MTLGDVIAKLDSEAEDGLEIFARRPWTADSPAVVGPTAPDGLELLCTVADAKEKLRTYVGDPTTVRVARIVAFG